MLNASRGARPSSARPDGRERTIVAALVVAIDSFSIEQAADLVERAEINPHNFPSIARYREAARLIIAALED